MIFAIFIFLGIFLRSNYITMSLTSSVCFFLPFLWILSTLIINFFVEICLVMQRIIRPTGGINKWLHFLPISLHKMVDQVLRHILSNTTFTTLFQGKLSAPYPVSNVQSLGLSSVLEADSKRIVTMVRDTFEK